MRKIPKSVTVAIAFRKMSDTTRLFKGQLYSRRDWFPRTWEIPQQNYRVTYYLDARGRFLVIAASRHGVRGVEYRNNNYPVCFLPESWIGLRVSRRVEKVKK